MKNFLKYILGTLLVIITGFGISFIVTFAFWIMIKQVPTLVGWSAFGTIIGAISMLLGIIILIITMLYQLFDIKDDREFVSWFLSSGDHVKLEMYKTWLNNRNK